jgi:hypothetical protein
VGELVAIVFTIIVILIVFACIYLFKEKSIARTCADLAKKEITPGCYCDVCVAAKRISSAIRNRYNLFK